MIKLKQWSLDGPNMHFVSVPTVIVIFTGKETYPFERNDWVNYTYEIIDQLTAIAQGYGMDVD